MHLLFLLVPLFVQVHAADLLDGVIASIGLKTNCNSGKWSSCQADCISYCAERRCVFAQEGDNFILIKSETWCPMPWQHKCKCRDVSPTLSEDAKKRIVLAVAQLQKRLAAKLKNLDEGHTWKKFYGDKRNDVRQPYMRQVLTNMQNSMYYAGFDESDPIFVKFIGSTVDQSMSCCYEKPASTVNIQPNWNQAGTWPGIIVGVNEANSKFQSRSTEELAGLIAHELSHSSRIVKSQDQTWWNYHINWNDQYQGTRDWTYDSEDVTNYMWCYLQGQHCPGSSCKGFSPCRPNAPPNLWDVPMNNARSYEEYIMAKKGCVYGEMLVPMPEGGKKVKFLEAGDKIIGSRLGSDGALKETWCNVIDVSFVGRGDLYGDFTDGHILRRDEKIVRNGDEIFEKNYGAMYSVFTDCPLMKNMDGVEYTPLADTFCGDIDLSWTEYLTLWESLHEIVMDFGTFWFDLDNTYANCKNDQICGDQPNWQDALPRLCSALLNCAKQRTEEACDNFEQNAQSFFQSYIQDEQVVGINEAHAKGFSVSQSVLNSQTKPSILFYAIGGIIFGVCCVHIAGIGYIWHLKRNQYQTIS